MNELKHKAEFRKALADYHVSAAAKAVLLKTPLVLLAGPSSSGRNTIINELVKTGRYYRLVSDTTRELRFKDGRTIEENGREYWFRSEKDVLADIKQGSYMEAAIIHDQQVSGWNIREVEAALTSHKIAVKDINDDGVETVHALKKDVTAIFVTLSNFKVWMERLQHRSVLPPEELQRRIVSSYREYETALKHDYFQFVINDKLSQAVADVEAIAKLSKQDPAKQAQGRKIAKAMYQEILAYLART